MKTAKIYVFTVWITQNDQNNCKHFGSQQSYADKTKKHFITKRFIITGEIKPESSAHKYVMS